MKFRIVRRAWWVFWTKGMCVWPFLWFRRREDLLNDRVYRHELEHCYQCLQMGRWRFYLTYLVLWVKHGYWDHPFEVEARARSRDVLTVEEERWRVQRKVDLRGKKF